MLNFGVLIVSLFLSVAFQVHPPTCDHAAPPEGMHYVCENGNSCNCHLEPVERDHGFDENKDKNKLLHTTPRTSCKASRVRYFVAPAYPTRARQAGKQGTVTALLTTNPAGAVNQVKIQAGDPLLLGTVTETLKKWRFISTGAIQTVEVLITFALNGTPGSRMVTTVSGSSPVNLVVTANPARVVGQ